MIKSYEEQKKKEAKVKKIENFQYLKPPRIINSWQCSEIRSISDILKEI